MPEEAEVATEVAPVEAPPEPTAVEEAPPEPAAPAEPEPAPEAEPPGPVSRREARKGLREEGAKSVDALRELLEGAPAEPEPEAEGTEEGEEATPAEGEPIAEGEEPKAEAELQPEPTEEEKTPEAIQIQLDRNHPATRGQDITITVANPEEERVVRALINGYTRRQDVASKDAQINELQQKIVRFESGQTAREKFEGMPEYEQAKAQYFKMLELEEDGSLEKGAADRYWKGFAGGYQTIADAEYKERWDKVEQERIDRDAAEWKEEAWSYAQRLPAHISGLPEFQRYFETAVESFNAEMGLGHYDGVITPGDREGVHNAFTRFFGSRLVREPAVIAAQKAQESRKQETDTAAAEKAEAAKRERERIERAAVEKFKKESAERRREGPPHPLGNLGGASTDRVPTDAEAGSEEPPADMSVHEWKKEHRRAAREDARRRFQR